MAPPITLYTFPLSQNAIRVEIALNEKGLPFSKVPVDIMKGEHKGPPLTDVTPRGQVPTLVWGDGDDAIVVYESLACIRFIDDMQPEPPLMPPPSDPRARAAALMRMEEFQAKLDGKNIFGSVVFRKLSREELGERVDKLLAELDRWNDYLAGKAYLAGEHFSLADIAVFPLLMHFEVIGYDYATKAPALKAYMDRMKARPSVAKTGWVEFFTRFVAEREPTMVLAD